MLTAVKSGNNIILQSSNVGSFQLERKINTGSWEPWTGSGWGGVPVLIDAANFTDYDLADGVYQYRYFLDPLYDYSGCVPIGSDPVGWTFYNYIVPDGQFGEILTVDDLHYSFAWGIDRTASNGSAWNDLQTKKLIEWSVYQLEKKLNIDIFPRQYYCDDDVNEAIELEKLVIKEFPYPNRRHRRYLTILRHRPVQEITRFDFYSPLDTKIFDLLPWKRIDKRSGQLWSYPKQGSLQTFAGYGWPWNLILDGINYPDAFHIDYKTGYRDAELIPEDLREIIGKIATCKFLNVIGDGLLAGFSSSSISLDGMSESFSSTQGVENGFFGSRIKIYLQDVEDYIEENRNKYGNFRIGSI